MDDIRFDLVTEELNPTFLFGVKIDRKESEHNYHSHDFPEIGVILEGEGIYHLDDEYIPVQTGDVLIFNPGTRHESIIGDSEKGRVEFFFGFTDVSFCGMKPNHIELRDGGNVLHTKGKTQRRIFRICEEMVKENQAKMPGRYFMLKSFLVQLLLNVVREETGQVELSERKEFDYAGKKDTAEKIADYLEEHYADKITLDHIAENMYLSPFYISKIFKSEMGESPIHYLIRVRMEKAKALLESGASLSIGEIAEKVGYEDAYHFSKLFKKTYGVSPSKMRKSLGRF